MNRILKPGNIHTATPGIAATALSAVVYKDQRFSDHAPLTVDYAWEWAPR